MNPEGKRNCSLPLSQHKYSFMALKSFDLVDTPGLKRRGSITDADSEATGDGTSLPGDRLSIGSELKSFGGSQGSLNSSALSSAAPDNPKQFESLKEMKGLMEQGIEK